jgi:hypothetical protein
MLRRLNRFTHENWSMVTNISPLERAMAKVLNGTRLLFWHSAQSTLRSPDVTLASLRILLLRFLYMYTYYIPSRQITYTTRHTCAPSHSVP